MEKPSWSPTPADRELASRLLAEGRLSREDLARHAATARSRNTTVSQILIEAGVLAAQDSQAVDETRQLGSRPSVFLSGESSRELPPEVAAAFADPARRVGRHVLVAELGRGGMGAVHRAYDLTLRRTVALKMILDPARAGAEQVRRFHVEASAAARLRHPHIVSVLEVGEHEGKPYLVMDLIEGKSLEALLRSEPVPAKRVAELVREVALALDHAHESGLVHRDVKPENVIVDTRGRAHLMDFGLARELDGERLTVTGAILGTPAYMAPEQAGGEVHDQGPWSDVYALGSVLYRALAGRPPFEATTVQALLKQVLFDEPAPLRTRAPRVHADLETIAHRCLAKERERRYPSAGEVARELERYLQGEPILARPAGGLERLGVWTRRNRKVAALGVSLALVLAGSAVVLSVLHARAEAERTKNAALEKKRLDEETAAKAERDRRRREVSDLVNAMKAMTPTELETAVDRLVRLGDGPDSVAVIGAELDVRTAELTKATRTFLRSALMPLPGEEKAPESLAGLEAALDALAKLPIDRSPDAATQALLDAAARRTIDRVIAGLRLEDGQQIALGPSWAKVRPGKTVVLGAFQQNRTLDVASRLADALGRIGREEAVEPLGRWLAALWLEEHAVIAARALVRFPGARAARCVLVAVRRLGTEGSLRSLCEDAAAARGLVAELSADTPETLQTRADLRRLSGDRAGALADYDRLLALKSDDAIALAARALVHAQNGDVAVARTDSERALTLAPRSPEVHIFRAKVLSACGDPGAAIEVLDAAAAIDGLTPTLLIERGVAKTASGDTRGAIQDLSIATGFGASANPEVLASLVTAHLRRHDIPSAKNALGEALRLHPRAALTAWIEGAISLAENDPKQSVEATSRAIERDPRLARAWRTRATALFNLGEKARAFEDASRAIELDPRDPISWIERGRLRILAREADLARQDVDRGVEIGARNAVAWQRRAIVLSELGDLRAALEACDRALALNARDVELFVTRATTRWRARDVDGALADLGRALELEPNHSTSLATRGIWRVQKGDLAGAVADLEKATELAPTNALAWGNLGTAYLQAKETDRAIAAFSRAIELSPKVPGFHSNRASAKLQKNDLRGAAEDMARAAELAPKDAQIRRNAAIVREKAGDRAGALADFKAYLELAPEDVHAEAIRAHVRELEGR